MAERAIPGCSMLGRGVYKTAPRPWNELRHKLSSRRQMLRLQDTGRCLFFWTMTTSLLVADNGYMVV